MSTPTIDSAADSAARTTSTPKGRVQGGLLDPKMLLKSTPGALRKLDPRTLWRNPVMFIVEIGAVWSTILAIISPSWFGWLIVVWLWLTVVFANLAEAVAEGRGKAQAESLRRTKTATMARRLVGWAPGAPVAKRKSRRRCFSRATSSSSRRDRSSRATAMSWKASPRWTNRPSRANPRR